MVDISKVRDDRPYEGIRLVKFHITKLFDEFTYTIPLNTERRVTAVVAPNGAGKTLCLRMISGLFKKRWSIFTTNRYSSISYTFSEGSIVTIEQIRAAPSDDGPQTKRTTFKLALIDRNGSQLAGWEHAAVEDSRLSSSIIDRYLPFLTRVGSNTWTHDETGEAHDLQEVVELYGAVIPEPYRQRFVGKLPDPITQITREIDCHLIETQRLLILREDGNEPYYRRTVRPTSTLAIASKADALKEIIAKDFGNYATLSQSLDRSFPRRLINSPTREPFEDLESRLRELERRRKELMDAGILDTETEADMPVALSEGEKLETTMARALSIYVEDNDQKLSSLTILLERIKLFKALIDQRFVSKDLHITKKNGIEVTSKGQKIPIEGLSSGEQHQLVLFFELLFQIKENALILIDEPELSLHVAWQKKFISDLLRIIDLNKFDVILATHSPQLIGRWNDLVVELGNIDDIGEDDAGGTN